MGRGFKKSFALSLCIVIMLGVVLAGVLFETPAKAQSVIYSDWSEWSTTAVSATDSREVETKTVSEYWRTRYDYDYYCTWHAGASAADAYEYSNTGGAWHFYVHDSSNPNNWWYYAAYSYTKNVQAYPAGYYMNVTPGQILSKANGQLPGSTAYMDYCKNSGNKTGYALRADQSGQEQGRNQIVFLVGSQDEYRDVTYYRYRTITKTYTVRFDANGGSGAPSNQTKIHGKTLTLSSTKPTRTGYTFKHWDAWPNGGGASYMPGGQFTYNDDSTLYAIWEPHTYTVSYDANGGTGAPSSQTKTYGVDLKLSNQIPTRTGYTFLGWSKSSTATTATYPYAGTYTDNAGATLYAVWQVKSYTLTYILSGEVYQTTTYNYGASVEPAPTPPEPEGMTFFGWSTTTPKTMPAYNVTIRGGYGLQFGSYPQSEVTDEETIELLNSKVSDSDWVSYNYYCGTGSFGSMVASDYMEYVDLDIDGDRRNDYRGVIMHNFRPDQTYYSQNIDFFYQRNHGYSSLEKIYWFSYDPLYWTVIDQETGLCVCDTVIDAQAFNNTMSEDSKIDIDGSNVSDYKYSDIRIWLNNDFRNTAFTSSEKTFIKLSEVDNPSSSSIISGPDLFNDYVFLLSKKEMETVSNAKCSDYSGIQGFRNYSYTHYTNYTFGNEYCLTRTSYRPLLGNITDSVCVGGSSSYSGANTAKAYDTSYGIRPALNLSLNVLDSTTEYTLTYRLNGKVYAQETHRAGEVIVPADDPEVPEGHQFSGWIPEVPSVMPLGDLTINGSIGMPFGSYPQSQVTDIDLIATLNNMVQQDDWTSYNYYSGTGEEETAFSSDYMEYADIDIDSDGTNDYRGVILHQYRPTLTYNERDASNSTQYANNFMLNEVYWFRYDPLYWIVISDEIDENEEKTGNSVLMCTSIIDSQPFVNVTGTDDFAASDMRTWLNNDFYNIAFTSSEKSRIVNADDNYVRLLSADEAFENDAWNSRSDEYDFCNSSRMGSRSSYAEAQGLDENRYALMDSFTISESIVTFIARTIEANGKFGLYSTSSIGNSMINTFLNNLATGNNFCKSEKYVIYDTNIGVRPVITVNLTASTHTLTFVPNNGEENVVITANFGTPVTAPNDPEMAGYTFVGWDTEVPVTMPDEDLVITALWAANEYTVTYIFDGVEYFAAPFESEVDTFTYGSEVAVRPNAVREGYICTDWEFTPALEDGKMPACNVVAESYSYINSYKVIWNYEVDCYEENYEFGEKITEYIPPEKEGYTFDGWTPEVAEKMPAYDLEYTALYTVNNYTITYNVDGELYDEKTYEFNSNVTKLEAPVKAGFIFSGWDDCEPDKMPAYNITLNGSFHPAPAEYTVETYIMNTDGTYNKSSEVFNSTTGENVTAEYTVPEGFSLNTDKSELEGVIAADNSLVLKVYLDRNRHNISFNDGTNTTTNELYYGDDINKPDDPKKEGYTFEGWSEDGETVVDVEETVPDRDIEYIAVWSINSYTITFKYGEVNDNAEYKTITEEFGKEIEEVADPEFTGYTFDGWDTDIPDTMPDEDMTITALWTVNEYTVRFETNGGTLIDSIKVSHGEKADKPEAPQKQDFIFTGWYTDEELKKPFDFNTPVTDNITLYAKWSSVIEFGSYPQSQVTSESILSELNVMLTEDSWVSYGYYTGGEASDFMKYADVEYNGEKYRAVTFSEYRPSVTTNTPEFSYSANSPYQQYNGYDTDAVYWFRYDPLVWRVLDYDTGLLLCENIIDSQPYTQIYYEKGEFSFEFYNGTDYSNYANDYSSSFIRAWLNEDFLNTAFSSSQQKKIITSQLDCFGATSTYDSETTNDKIFLLSYDEVLNPDYGFASENEADAKRIAAGSDYAKCQVLWPNSYIGSTYTTPSGDSSSYWRLRTGGESSSISDIVGYDGAVSRNSKVGVTGTYAGIRPSLRTDIGTINSHTITFDTDGGTEIDPITQDYGTEITKPADPEKEGCTFDGWDTDIPDTMPDEDMTITALWIINEYSVTYKLDGADYFATPYESAVDKFNYGETVPVREKAVKEGYTVSDWAFAPALVDGKMPAGDVVANAISTVNKYTLTVNYVMNDGSDAPEAHTEQVTYGAGYSVETPAVTGYTPDTELVEGTMDSTEGKTVTVTYYVNSYKITYNVDGKLYDEKTYDFNADVTKLAAPEKQGYVFSGWDKDEPEKMPAENLVLSGSFSAATNTKYTVETYVMNLSGEYDKTSKGFTGTTGETATAEYTVPEGFSLNTDKSELEGVIAADNSLVLKVYLDRNRHNISFNDGTNTTTDELYYGDEIVKPDDPKKEGYTFEGWSEDGETVVDVEETVPDRDIEYIAVWSINSYTITFKYGEVNDNAEYKTITEEFGKEIEEVANPEFTGYSFGGWDTDIPDTMPAKDMTITALWSANEYKITYKLDGVDYFATPYESAVDTFTYGSEVTVREKAVKEGYTVSDWAFTPALVDGKMPAGDAVANATSSANSYTVTYKVDGEQYGEIDTVEYGAPLAAREAPAKTGYTFSGWSDIPETMPAHDIVIEGTFAVNSHTIFFDADGGTEIDPITQDYGTEITKPADPEKEGCTFDGWDTDIPDTMPDEDLTITAKWTVNEYSVTYKLDGVEYFATPYESAVDTFTYGSEVTVRPNAVKEGYTVSDWALTPALVDGKMPAGDVVANATSSANSYTVTYKVDGVQYGKVDTVEFGAPITARQEPEKDGYIFSGWSAIPETMPACNIEITGSFNMIYYTATFVTVNDDGSYTVVDKVPFPYGASTIDEPAVPEKDNYEGVWEEYVPGNSDITVKAIYTPIDPNDNSEVITEKTVNSFDGKVASITLSASAASRVIKMESSSTKPVDVVLVLDLSGSMNDPLGSDTSTTKLEALKKCTVDFIKDLNSNAVASGADHRVALVSFASGSEKYANQKWENTGLVLTQDGGFVSYPEASSHYDKAFMSPGNITGPNQAIVNAVNGFTASGATCTHCGLKMAESILAQNNGADREKVVILITDGTPTVGSEVKSEINASAPIAVTYAKNLKKSGVKLYTVGVSAYADENASFTNDEDGVKTRTNSFGNEEFISFDFNRFLNIVSSNYPDSSSMSNYGSKTNDGYYMPVTDTSRLGDIFTKILRSTVYKNLIFKRCNIVDTLSSDFVMTMEQENAFRASLKDEYGISDDDISVIRNEDGTTTVRVNKVPVIRTVENGATVYRASVTFNASLIETQAGSYETNTDDAYIEVQDETVGTFDKPEAVTLNSDRNIVVFKLNGEIYTVSEGDIGDEVVAPVSEFAAWNIPEGTVITGNYAEFEADEIVTDPYTVTWNIDGNLSQETYNFGQRINEPEVPEKEGFDFAFFSPSIPAVMPARNVTFTAVYKPKHVHSFKQTGFYGTCTEGLTIVSTCSCGEIREEKQPAAVHNFSAVVENISGNALTDTLVCETCGASERHTLEFSTVERHYGRTYIVDLTLEKSGTIIQPAEGSSVKIMIPWENQGYTNRNVTIYRVNENNVQTKYTPTFEDGYLVFYADHFSIYIIDETDESGNPVNNISFNEATCSLNGHSFEWKYNNDATSEADGTETEVCKNCGEKGETRTADGTKLSTDPGQNTEPEYRLPSSFKEKTAAYKTIVTVSVTLNDIPSDAKVIIDGKEADVKENTYSMEIGQLKATKAVLIEVVKDGKVLDSSTLTVKVESNFFSRLISFFANFLFNMFKWREVTVKF